MIRSHVVPYERPDSGSILLNIPSHANVAVGTHLESVCASEIQFLLRIDIL